MRTLHGAVVTALLVLLVAAGWAESQPPTPSPSKSSQNPQGTTNQRKQHAKDKQRDAENLPALIKVIQSEVAKEITKQITDTQDKSTTSEWWSIGAAGLSALATVVIAVFTFVLARVSKKQWEVLNESVTVAKKAANAAEKSADVAEKLVDRPFIVVSNVKVLKSTNVGGSVPAYIDFTVANHGKSPAVIINAFAEIIETEQQEPNTPGILEISHNLRSSPFMAPGEQRDHLKIFFPEGMNSTLMTCINTESSDRIFIVRPIIKDCCQLFFSIKIYYDGASGEHYWSGFCWIWEGDCLIPFGSSKYNYVKKEE